ncbi:MAG: LacI family DNA-binding transcriptional regulator [Micromonosporaceae bacterium]|nr:LacI family DNA-binding transcriptional regulator [Micromonosporaceae bacterium]
MRDVTAQAIRPGRRRGEATVATIARLAGVSPPTVSKVLNGRSGVAEDTRERVEALLREHGYRRPDAVLPAAVLEVVFHALEGQAAVAIMRGVEEVARTRELAVGFSEISGRNSDKRGWVEQVLARRPTGVIGVYASFSPREQARFAAAGIPLVALDPTGEPLHTTPSVGAANWSGGLAAARHVIELGHRRIAVIGGPVSFLCSRARLDGFHAAMDEAGIPVDPALIRHGRFMFDDGLSHGLALLKFREPPTAIICGDDLQAMGVYEAARQLGLRIPDDLSVIGFDDIDYAQWMGPPLTTVRQPLAKMGATAAELVLMLADGEEPTQTRVELATSLIVRGSTAPPRRA